MNINYEDGFEYIVDNDSAGIVGYKGEDRYLRIPREIGGYIVNKVYDRAFAESEIIERVFFPNSITELGNQIFLKCSQLEYVKFPDKIEKSGNGLFAYCESLKIVNFPKEGIEEFSFMFVNCISIESITIPEGVKNIGPYAFRNCKSLSSVSLPQNTIEIGARAFALCEKLEKIEVPNNVTIIDEGAFGECFNLKEVILPKSLILLNHNVFLGCKSITHLEIPENVQVIGEKAFCECEALESIEIPKKVRIIAPEMFKGCKNLKSIKLHDNICVATDDPFLGCDNLTSLDIPKGCMANKWAFLATNRKAFCYEKYEWLPIGMSSSCQFPYLDNRLRGEYGSGKELEEKLNEIDIKKVKPNGIEYEMISIKNLRNSNILEKGISNALLEAYERISTKGNGVFKLYEEAINMRKIFRVEASNSDVEKNREFELNNGYLRELYLINAMRSFAWVVSEYCYKNNVEIEDLLPDKINQLIEYAYRQNGSASKLWLNYCRQTSCKALCAVDGDVECYYIPDKTLKKDQKLLLSSITAIKLDEELGGDSPIYPSTASLEGLRRELEYLYPAIHKIWKELEESRDYSVPLEGNSADVLYAWCAFTLAAKEPFVIVRGPADYSGERVENLEKIEDININVNINVCILDDNTFVDNDIIEYNRKIIKDIEDLFDNLEATGVEMPGEGNIKGNFRTDLMLFVLSLANADHEISLTETEFVNKVFDMDMTPENYVAFSEIHKAFMQERFRKPFLITAFKRINPEICDAILKLYFEVGKSFIQCDGEIANEEIKKLEEYISIISMELEA